MSNIKNHKFPKICILFCCKVILIHETPLIFHIQLSKNLFSQWVMKIAFGCIWGTYYSFIQSGMICNIFNSYHLKRLLITSLKNLDAYPEMQACSY